MFTSAAPSSPTVSASTISTTSPAPRSSGLRGGLSFLRSYTHAGSGAGTAVPPGSPHSPISPAKGSGRPRATSTTPPISPSSLSSAASTSQSAAARPALLSRTHTAPEPLPDDPSITPGTMTRNRAETAAPQLTVRNYSGPTEASPSLSTPDERGERGDHKNLPSIRFIPHTDPRAPRPSLQFSTITRTLPDESAIIRVGRYSERDNIPEIPTNVPSAAAVGFKSKVVSRKHCELWCKDGSWFIKDVKSSSGTFLNHIRLSQPNVESKPFRLKDGDIIQLGIDFRGGEEMIFRCVKIRIECNRGWQQALNTFNKQTHQRLRNLGKARKEGDNASMHTSECSICLMSIAPCQSLFVAPCSHVWHYKCIRPILNGSTWPNFLCPNCRAVADLEADVDDVGEFESWDGEDDEHVNGDGTPPSSDPDAQDRHITPKASTTALGDNTTGDDGRFSSAMRATIDGMANLTTTTSSEGGVPVTPQQQGTLPAPSSSVTQPVHINIQSANDAGLSPLFLVRSGESNLSADRAPECPMTPRNDAGPFVLDGSGGRAAGQRLRDGESPVSAVASNASAPTLPSVDFD